MKVIWHRNCFIY